MSDNQQVETDWQAAYEGLEHEVHKWQVKYERMRDAHNEMVQKKNSSIQRVGEKYRKAQEDYVDLMNEHILLKAKHRAAVLLLGERVVAAAMDEMEQETA